MGIVGVAGTNWETGVGKKRVDGETSSEGRNERKEGQCATPSEETHLQHRCDIRYESQIVVMGRRRRWWWW